MIWQSQMAASGQRLSIWLPRKVKVCSVGPYLFRNNGSLSHDNCNHNNMSLVQSLPITSYDLCSTLSQYVQYPQNAYYAFLYCVLLPGVLLAIKTVVLGQEFDWRKVNGLWISSCEIYTPSLSLGSTWQNQNSIFMILVNCLSL